MTTGSNGRPTARGRISKLPLAAIRRLRRRRLVRHDVRRRDGADPGRGARAAAASSASAPISRSRPSAARLPPTATAVAACLDRLPGPLPPILLSSFMREAVAEAAAQAPHIPRGMLSAESPARLGEGRRAARLHHRSTPTRPISIESMAAEICAAGYPLLAYTVNDPDRARQLFGWGIASVFSDAPDIMTRPPAGP